MTDNGDTYTSPIITTLTRCDKAHKMSPVTVTRRDMTSQYSCTYIALTKRNNYIYIIGPRYTGFAAKEYHINYIPQHTHMRTHTHLYILTLEHRQTNPHTHASAHLKAHVICNINDNRAMSVCVCVCVCVCVMCVCVCV